MGKTRKGTNPLLLNDAGLKRMWEAAIKQAVEDVDSTKQNLALEAYHWLMTERSDAVFALLGVYSDDVRSVIRQRVKDGTLGVEQLKKVVIQPSN
jgi:hypothetical protein